MHLANVFQQDENQQKTGTNSWQVSSAAHCRLCRDTASPKTAAVAKVSPFEETAPQVSNWGWALSSGDSKNWAPAGSGRPRCAMPGRYGCYPAVVQEEELSHSRYFRRKVDAQRPRHTACSDKVDIASRVAAGSAPPLVR